MQTALLRISSNQTVLFRMDTGRAGMLGGYEAVDLGCQGPELSPSSQALNNKHQAETAEKQPALGPCNISKTQFPHL